MEKNNSIESIKKEYGEAKLKVQKAYATYKTKRGKHCTFLFCSDSLGIPTISFVIDSSIHSEKISGVQFCQNFNCFELLTKQLFLNFYFKVRMQSPHIGLIVRLYCKFKGFFQHNKPF